MTNGWTCSKLTYSIDEFRVLAGLRLKCNDLDDLLCLLHGINHAVLKGAKTVNDIVAYHDKNCNELRRPPTS